MSSLMAFMVVMLHLCVCACVPQHHARNSVLHKPVDGNVLFVLKSDPVWQIPSPGHQTEVQVVLEITNHERTPIRFPIMDKFSVSLESAEGNVLIMEGGQDVLVPGKPISDPVQPGSTLLIDLDGRLGWRSDRQLELTLKDGLGSTWRIGPLKPGEYMLKMTYENQATADQNASDVWSGKAHLTPVTIQILN